jgi:hypothetical protein
MISSKHLDADETDSCSTWYDLNLLRTISIYKLIIALKSGANWSPQITDHFDRYKLIALL